MWIKKHAKAVTAAALALAAAALCLHLVLRQRPVDLSDFPPVSANAGNIWLYGEQHASPDILDYELERWREFYAAGARDLFVELPYYSAGFLNLWMEADDDTVLEELWDDWDGTAMHSNGKTLEFYRAVKAECPETVFHGTDVGHQYDTTGARYLAYLESSGMGESEAAERTREAIEQGEKYYSQKSAVYRENRMVENFIREFDALHGADVMGIYGSAHTHINATAQGARSLPCMANQLAGRYGALLHTEDITALAKRTEPLREETLEVGGKTYRASYFGEENISHMFPKYQSRAFWRLEDAYDDFKSCAKTGDKLPIGNYPMRIATGEVFVIDYTLKNGTVERRYYRSDGTEFQGQPATVGFKVK